MGPEGWKNSTYTRTYAAWNNMHARCYNPASEKYADYGRRGITVCERWHSYDAFVDDMGECPEDLTLDRIDNDGNYELGNTRWATRTQQARNKRNSVILTFNGKTQHIADWAEELGLNKYTIKTRLDRGASVEQALRPVVGK
jgi:hypothetical protein